MSANENPGATRRKTIAVGCGIRPGTGIRGNPGGFRYIRAFCPPRDKVDPIVALGYE